jgi:hypothetical protein
LTFWEPYLLVDVDESGHPILFGSSAPSAAVDRMTFIGLARRTPDRDLQAISTVLPGRKAVTG